MVLKNHTAYLSASRLSCYEWCPAEFEKRYVFKRDEPPTSERLFGTAVHKGIEAHYLGEDHELAFLGAWRDAKRELQAAHQPVQSWLTERGLELIDQVRSLNLTGETERRIGVIHPDIPLPFIGYVDLWSEGNIYDFKTTGFTWKPNKADAQIFQPAIYSQAHADVFGTIPSFTFVVLSRVAGPPQLIDATRTGDQILAAFDRAKEILDLIEARVFDCQCGRHLAQAA